MLFSIPDNLLPADFYERAAELSQQITDLTGEPISTTTANGVALDEDRNLYSTKEAYFYVDKFRIGEMRYSVEYGYQYRVFKDKYDQMIRLEELTQSIEEGPTGVAEILYECSGEFVPEEDLVIADDLVGIMVVDEVFPDNYRHELTEAWAYDNLTPEDYLDFLEPSADRNSIIFDSERLRDKYPEVDGYIKDAGVGPSYYRVETVGRLVDDVFVLHKWYNPVYGNGDRLVRLLESRIDIDEFMTLGAYKDI